MSISTIMPLLKCCHFESGYALKGKIMSANQKKLSCNQSFYYIDYRNIRPMLSEEENMINGCIDGKRSSQKMLYDRFAAKMLGVCMRYAKDRAEAEDMVQEGFIKIFQNIARFKHEGSFEGWIRRIMVFTAINFFKHRSRKFQEDLDQENYDAPFEDEIIEKISAKEIIALVQQLPDGYKLVFNLYAVEGYTHKEIGEILGIAIGTSKSQYARARAMMQQLLAKHYQILNEPFREPQ
jgi:RNA polymerase sigma factor (sigma-70 family)